MSRTHDLPFCSADDRQIDYDSVPDLPAKYPDRHVKSAMIGLFKGSVEVMGYVRAESVRFAAVSNEEMRGEGYTANATGITFIVSQEDLAKVISKMMEAGQRQFPTLLNFPIPKDYPICCTVTY